MRNFIHKKKIALGTGFCSIACMMMLGACDTVFDVHPYDVRVKGDTDLATIRFQREFARTLDLASASPIISPTAGASV